MPQKYPVTLRHDAPNTLVFVGPGGLGDHVGLLDESTGLCSVVQWDGRIDSGCGGLALRAGSAIGRRFPGHLGGCSGTAFGRDRLGAMASGGHVRSGSGCSGVIWAAFVVVEAPKRLISVGFQAKSHTVINNHPHLFNKTTRFGLNPLPRLKIRVYIWLGSFFKLINPKP
jgi:hypothetical protein